MLRLGCEAVPFSGPPTYYSKEPRFRFSYFHGEVLKVRLAVLYLTKGNFSLRNMFNKLRALPQKPGLCFVEVAVRFILQTDIFLSFFTNNLTYRE